MSASRPPLGRKKGLGHAVWASAWEYARIHVDTTKASEIVAEAAQRVRERSLSAERAVIAWSGGKDSIALEIVATAAGITDSVLVTASPELEFPEFLDWVSENSPQGLRTVVREGINLEWLKARPHLLFPSNAKDASHWYKSVQHAGQRIAMREMKADLMLLGRRTADGNYVGPEGPHGREYFDRQGGFVRFSPIAHWSHEETLNVIAAYRPNLPPIYSYPRGFEAGTGTWAGRTGLADVAAGWEELARIDPQLLHLGAHHRLPGAAEALNLLKE